MSYFRHGLQGLKFALSQSRFFLVLLKLVVYSPVHATGGFLLQARDAQEPRSIPALCTSDTRGN